MASHSLNKLSHKGAVSAVAKHRALLAAAQEANKPATQSKPISDGGGLYLVITKAGRARFMHKFPWNGRMGERWFPGDFPELELSEAREMRDADRKLLARGINPIAHLKAQVLAANGVPTFGEWAQDNQQLAPDNVAGKRIWLRQMTGLDTDGITAGVLINLPMDQITKLHVKAVIEPIWRAHPNTAKKLCGRIARLWAHWQENASTDEDKERRNPADWSRMEDLIGSAYEPTGGCREALDWSKVPSFMEALRQRPQLSARALELVIMCGSRSGEIRGLRWREIDLVARTITIPAERMKGIRRKRQAHIIPLTSWMLNTIRRAIPDGWTWADMDPSALVFPNSKGKQFYGRDLLEHIKLVLTPGVARKDRTEVTVHGFRSALMDWGVEQGQEVSLMKMCLAHRIGNNVTQAYLRATCFDRRVVVMRSWAKHLKAAPVQASVRLRAA